MPNSGGISRRDFIRTAGAVTAGMVLGGAETMAQGPSPPLPPGGAKRPNILWICTDQQRADTISALGNSHIHTPNTDRLAAEGVAFTQAYGQNPVCTPSRASFLTGRYPREAGPRRNGQAMPGSEVLVTRMLADAGYDCGLAGKLHLSPTLGRAEKRVNDGYRVFHWSHDPSPQWKENEYQQWLASKGVKWRDIYKPDGKHAYAGAPPELHQTTWCADRAIDFINEKHSTPWLMSVNIYAPHHPFDPPKEYLDRFDPDKLPDPDFVVGELANKPPFQRARNTAAGMGFSRMSPRERREVTAAYYAMIEQIDDNVGRMLKALEDSGERENTIVIFMSDHGELLGDHGMYLKGPYLYDCCLHVPLILSWPGHFKAGLRSDALVELVDIVPTLLTATGLPVPERVQGRPLNGICTGADDPHKHKDSVYAEYYDRTPFSQRIPSAPMMTMLRTRTAKIVDYAGMEIGELYDLEKDPGEHVNLWDEPKSRDLKMEMLKRCLDACVDTQDPLPRVEAAW